VWRSRRPLRDDGLVVPVKSRFANAKCLEPEILTCRFSHFGMRRLLYTAAGFLHAAVREFLLDFNRVCDFIADVLRLTDLIFSL
jgi:hypothetical protein